MGDRLGQQLGNYRLVKLLGKGGFAEVYLGQHVRLASKQTAIKILHLIDVDARKFQEEAETTEKLVHPHIVRLLDFDIEQGTPFLVLDYAPGGSLRTRHPKGSILPLATIGEYLKELAPALQYAHDQHILHRDIKPDNMLIGRGEELLLSDFGIAVLTQTGRTSLSSAYVIGGTPYYMAPETYRGRPEKASDQYALAVVVYEWLCGSVPFSEGNFIQLGYQHAHEPVPPLREKDPAISPEVEAVIMKALAKEPKDRFASVQAFANALEFQGTTVIQKPKEQWLNEGKAHLDANHFEDALEAYEQAIRANPNQAEAYYGKGEALYKLDREKEALEAYDRAIRLDPTSSRAYRGKGDTLRALSRKNEALAAYERAIQLDPDYSDAYVHKGWFLTYIKRNDEALALAERAIRLHPNEAWAYCIKGDALTGLGRVEEALSAYDYAIQLVPKTEHVYIGKGDLLSQLERHEEALVAFDQAIKLAPASAFAHSRRGLTLARLGRYEEALIAYDQAILVDPSDSSSYLYKGNLLFYSLQQRREALAVYEQCIQATPNSIICFSEKIRSLRDMKLYDEALATAERQLQIRPSEASSYTTKSEVLIELKRYEEALTACERAIQLEPESEWSYYRKGEVLEKLERYDEALVVYEQATRLNTGLVNIELYYYAQGKLLKKLERYWEALAAYEQVIQRDPKGFGSWIWSDKGEVLEKLKRHDEALTLYDQVIREKPDDLQAWNAKAALLDHLGRKAEVEALWSEYDLRKQQHSQ